VGVSDEQNIKPIPYHRAADFLVSLGIRAAHWRQEPTIFFVLTNLFVGWILERCWTSL